MEKLFYVYQHTRLDTNEVFYIGVGRTNSRRAWESRKRNIYWKNIVNKNNGIFKVDILFTNLSGEEAEVKEIELIKQFGRSIFNEGSLCNFQEGGNIRTGNILNSEQRKHIGSFHIGNKHALGYRHNEESRKKMSESRKGKSTKKKGTSVSEETKRKMSESHKGNKSILGKVWINNGKEKKLILNTDSIPENWYRGRKLINLN